MGDMSTPLNPISCRILLISSVDVLVGMTTKEYKTYATVVQVKLPSGTWVDLEVFAFYEAAEDFKNGITVGPTKLIGRTTTSVVEDVPLE